ncbi:MAG: type II toxin-antitoxin system RelE family toxin [Betaproteobacteria bacterium]
MRLRFADAAAEAIRHLHPHGKRKVRAALKLLASQPEAGKALKDELAGLRSFRVGRFRIVYGLQAPGLVDIVAFGPRELIYEQTRRLLRRSPV